MVLQIYGPTYTIVKTLGRIQKKKVEEGKEIQKNKAGYTTNRCGYC